MLFCERGNKNVVTEKVCIGKRDSKIRVIVLTTYFTHKVRHVPFRPNEMKRALFCSHFLCARGLRLLFGVCGGILPKDIQKYEF